MLAREGAALSMKACTSMPDLPPSPSTASSTWILAVDPTRAIQENLKGWWDGITRCVVVIEILWVLVAFDKALSLRPWGWAKATIPKAHWVIVGCPASR